MPPSRLPARLPPVLWSALALVALLLVNGMLTDGFLHLEMRGGALYGTPVDILRNGTPIILAAIGMTLVIATGGVDLSVGALVAISGAVAAVLVGEGGVGAGPAIIAALAACTVAGLANGAMVATLRIQPIVATLVLMVAGRGIAQLITEGQVVTFNDPVLNWLAGGHLLGIPAAIIIAALFAVTAGLALRWTSARLFIEATGDREAAARLSGVPVNAVKLLVYGFSGFCAGAAGLIEASDIRAADANTAGLYLELDAILAVVLGGTALSGGRFSLLGAIIGAIIIQTLTTMIMTLGFDAEWTLVVKAIVVLAVCLLLSERARRLWRRGR